jgi:hypothetical protein
MLLQGYGLYLDTSRVTEIVTKDVSWIVIFYTLKTKWKYLRLNNDRILLANLEISFHCTTIESCVDATTVNSRVEQRACRLVQTFSMEHFSGNILQEIFM